MDIVKQVEALMVPICAATKTTLVDVKYEAKAGTWYLQIFVDSANGLSMDECVAVTELISAKLDAEDVIASEYLLEVSSPGAERPLKTAKEVAAVVGSQLFVVVCEAIDGIFEFQGDLISFEADTLVLECLFKTRKKLVKIDYRNVATARLAVKF